MYKGNFASAAVLTALFLSVGLGAVSQSPPGPIGGEPDPFAAIDAAPITLDEALALDGGDVFIALSQPRDKLTVIATDNRYVPGGRVDTMRQYYEVPAHNNVSSTLKAPLYPTAKTVQELPNRTDMTTIPGKFPSGTWSITGVSPREDKYGPNMIKTDAVGKVDVVKASKDGKKIEVAYGKYEDTEYAIHSNTNPMSQSKSYGCIIVSQKDNVKIAATITADRTRSTTAKQTITVKKIAAPSMSKIR